MIRERLGRLFTMGLSAVLALMLLGVGSVTAATPDWFITIVPTPDKVGAGNGHDAGFVVTVGNDGPSQINALSVTTKALDTPGVAPTYLSDLAYNTGGSVSCAIAVPQTCQIGTLVAGQSVTFTVAYAVPSTETGNFELNVSIRAGTGDTESDGPKKSSRGDAFDLTRSATIAGGNFDGGFVFGADIYQTNPALGNRNIQATSLTGAPQLVPVTIEDGIPSDADCDAVGDDPACVGLFGEWSLLNVKDGNGGVPFETPFKVTLMVRGGPGANADVQVVHILDDGSIDVIDETCAFSGATPTTECLVAMKNGNVWTIDVWLFTNGSIRGGI